MAHRPELDGLGADEIFFAPGGGQNLLPGDWAFDHLGMFCARLPCGDFFRNHGARPWDVAGDRAAPTLSPSIHCLKREKASEPMGSCWHGFLQGGKWVNA